MSQISVLTPDRHGLQRWQRYENYLFSRGNALAPLVLSELPRAVMSLPIAFIRQDERYMPVAVLGLDQGKNLFVAHNGKWLGNYVPASIRGYPFVLLPNTDNSQLVLCIDESSGLLSSASDGRGEVLFDESGRPSPEVQSVMNFLTQVQQGRLVTETACDALTQHNCIQPLSITHKIDESHERKIEGLYQVDEAALNALPDDAYLALRACGALLMANCQLLSMQHLSMLGQLADAHAKADKAAQPIVSLPTTENGDLDLSFLADAGSISFSYL